MKRFVIGDIHGRIEALKQVLEFSKFDYKKDKLIVLGDVVDGGYNTYECVEELLKIKNLIYVLGNHDCLDKNTELLTKNGWIKYNKISKNDIVYSYDIENNKGVWTNINKIIIKNYNGDMIKINGVQCDMLVTPNHRIFHNTKKIQNKKSYYNYTVAKDLKGSYYIPASAYDNLSDCNITDNMLQLCAWILADGSIDKRGNKIIYQSKENYVKEIKTLLNQLNLKFTERVYKTKKKIICGRMMKNEPKESHDFHISIKSARTIPLEKKEVLPDWAYVLNRKQFGLFLKTLIKGDGSFYPKGSMVLYGKKEFLDQIQILCLTKGYRAYLGFCKTGNYYRLNITKTNVWGFDTSTILKRQGIKKQTYNDMVWCLNVPLSNFMVRRNGTHYFTGNCWFMNHIKSGWAEEIWLLQGGFNTIDSYTRKNKINIPVTHQHFFNKGKYYYIEDMMLFVHGGIEEGVALQKQKKETLIWDRELIETAKYRIIHPFEKVFVGHTTTQTIGNCTVPLRLHNLWMMDCGAGYTGALAIMNIDTEEYWVSDPQKPAGR